MTCFVLMMYVLGVDSFSAQFLRTIACSGFGVTVFRRRSYVPFRHNNLEVTLLSRFCCSIRFLCSVYVWCGSAAKALERALTLSRALAFQRSLESQIDKVLRIYLAPSRYIPLSAAVRGHSDPTQPFVLRTNLTTRVRGKKKAHIFRMDDALEQSPLVRACCGRNPLFLRY